MRGIERGQAIVVSGRGAGIGHLHYALDCRPGLLVDRLGCFGRAGNLGGDRCGLEIGNLVRHARLDSAFGQHRSRLRHSHRGLGLA